MILHTDTTLFRDAVTITAQRMNLPEIYIEKDYWVTLALHRIFTSPMAGEIVFKGGTSLSKCFSFIRRFSEDIDLVVLRNQNETGNQLKAKLKQISQLLIDDLPEIELDGITNKKGMIRKTAHSYAKLFEGNYWQIRDVVIVEASWLGYHEPYTTKQVSSFIYEMMQNAQQLSIAEEYRMLPFDVKVLEPSRTICEKIMSLVRFSYTVEPLDDLKQKIRHVYDLHQLLQEKELSNFFNSSAFDEMLVKVANDDVISFKNNNDWLIYHPNKARMFADLDSVWNQLTPTYNGAFKDLVFGNLPNETAVLATLIRIKERLSAIEWAIKI